MNKKIILIVVALLAVVSVGSYFASQSIEAEVEQFIRSEIAKTPIKVEDVKFSASSGTLTLTNISFADTVGKVESALIIDSAKLEGFNEEILNPKTSDFLVFDDLFLTNVSYTASLDGTPLANSKVESIHIKDYKQNIIALWEEMKKDNTSEAFYTAALSHAYKEVRIKNYNLTMFEPFVPETQMLSFEEIFCDSANFMDWNQYPNGKPFSFAYKNTKLETPEVDIVIDNMSMKDFLMPHPSLYTLLMNNAYDFIAQNSPLISQPEFQEKVLHYILGDTPLFENLSMEGIQILPKDIEAKKELGDDITLNKMSVALESGDVVSASFLLEKFSFSWQILYPEIEPSYVPILNAFLGDTLTFDFQTKHVFDINNKEYISKIELRMHNLAGASLETKAVADLEGTLIEKIIELSSDFKELQFKKVAISYEDLGLLPLIGQIAVKETRLPLDALLPLATAEIHNFSKVLENKIAIEKSKVVAGLTDKREEDFLREERMYDSVQKISDMILKMIEKPGSFSAELVCHEPMSANAIADQILAVPFKSNHKFTEIDFNLDVKQGEKTFKEATPQELLSK